MGAKRLGWKLLLAVVMVILAASQVVAQQPPAGGGRAGRGGGGAGGAGFDPAAMRQRMEDRIKGSLQATDEEWKAILPRLDKVLTLSRQAGPMRMGARPGGAAPGAAAGAVVSAIESKSTDLEATLANKDAKPAEIKAKLAALREARTKAKQQLAEAQTSLKELLTQRQEAQLVLLGVLE